MNNFSKVREEHKVVLEKARKNNELLEGKVRKLQEEIQALQDARVQAQREHQDYENLMSTMRSEIETLKVKPSNMEEISNKSFGLEELGYESPVVDKTLESDSRLRVSDLEQSQDDHHMHSETSELQKKDRVDSLVKEFMRARPQLKVTFKKVGDRK